MRSTLRHRATWLLVLVWLATGFRTTGQQPSTPKSVVSSTAEIPPLFSAEFPWFDAAAWRLQRTGLAAKVAARRLLEAPDSPETAEILAQVGRVDDAWRVVRRVVERHPEDIARVFDIVSRESPRFLRDHTHGYQEQLYELIDATKKRLPDLPREEAARAARSLIHVDGRPWLTRSDGGLLALGVFVREYAGTEAALLAEVDLIDRRPIPDRVAALDTMARSHPGTVAGAKAFYLKGIALGAHGPGQDADPTERFMRLLDIARELGSGRYPQCEWVDRAPGLVLRFFTSKPTFAPGNLDRMLEGYQSFLRDHVDDEHPAGSGLEVQLTYVLMPLYELQGDGVGGLERLLSELELVPGRGTSASYLRALVYMRLMTSSEAETERSLFFNKARDTLTKLNAAGDGIYQRSALASLASLHYYKRDYTAARDHYGKYLRLHPNSDWAWVAALRVGQCDQELGDWKAAAESYRIAAEKYASVPIADVLGHVWAANADAALLRFDRSLASNQHALSRWNKDYGLSYSIQPLQAPLRNPPLVRSEYENDDIRWQWLADKVAQQARTLSLPGGALVERGRWLLEQGQWREARVPLEQMMKKHPRSPAVPEARNLAHHARLEWALELADRRKPGADESVALKELEAIAREPYDFGVTLAKIAQASIQWRRGTAEQAEALMLSALNELVAHQSAQRPSTSPTSLAQEVAAIRSVVFRPKGDGLLSGWRSDRFSSVLRFLIVNPDLSVKHPGGDVVRVSIQTPVSEWPDLLFLTVDETVMFRRILLTSRKTSGQLLSPSVDVVALWKKFVPVTTSDDGALVLHTAPTIYEIEFLNPERTKAAVRFAIGHEGATAILEKDGGIWKAKGIVDHWIS